MYGSRTVKSGRYHNIHPGHSYSNFSFSRNTFFFKWALSRTPVYAKHFFCLVKVGTTSTGETSLFLAIDPEGLLQKPRVPENLV